MKTVTAVYFLRNFQPRTAHKTAIIMKNGRGYDLTINGKYDPTTSPARNSRTFSIPTSRTVIFRSARSAHFMKEFILSSG
jgi:hypothetical protein